MKGVAVMTMTESEKLKDAVKSFSGMITGNGTIIGLTMGSGLGFLADQIEEPQVFPYAAIPHFPQPSNAVQGHGAELVIGRMGDAQVIAMKGRQHPYQGMPLPQTVYLTRLMILLGARILIITNVVGAAHKNYQPGEFVVARDHIAPHSTSVLVGDNEPDFGPRFPDMSEAYDTTVQNPKNTVK